MAEVSNVSKEVRKKGIRLFRSGRVSKDMDSEKRAHFTVEGETEKHSVIFHKDRGVWSCACKYSSMKGRECSHIYACKLSLK
jgi:hypothetical protein